MPLTRMTRSSAHKYREWWANEKSADTSHVQAKAWMAAGWLTDEVSLAEEQAVFIRQ